jgi:hypothetical protein
MAITPQVSRAKDAPANIKRIGRTVIRASLFVMFMTLVAFLRMGLPPMGDIGHFVHDSSFVLIPMSLWGVATGIGLRRGWRWAQISMLVFGVLMALVCAVPALAFFLMERGGFGWLQIAGLRSIGLSFLIPPALVVRWYLYFIAEDARAYFWGTGQSSTIAM